jgi:Bacterial protein of unknown function (DUF885)
MQIFMKECGSPEPEARREAYRGTSDPGYINYAVCKLEILKLRDDYRARMGDKFSLADFHDRLFAGGLAPMKIIRREGVVTLLKEEHENSASRIFSNDRDCLVPHVHSRRTKGSVCLCRNEMALDVESVVGGCVS